MKMEHVDLAAREAKAYRLLLQEIDHFNQMRWFIVHCGTDQACAVKVTPEPVGLLQSGSNRVLADKIQAAMRDYYATQKQIAEQSLANLGVIVG